MTTEQRVLRIIANQFCTDVDALSLDTRLMDDLDADSLDVIEIQMTCDMDFRIAIPDDDLDDIKTVRDVIAAVNKHLPDKKVFGEQLDD